MVVLRCPWLDHVVPAQRVVKAVGDGDFLSLPVDFR